MKQQVVFKVSLPLIPIMVCLMFILKVTGIFAGSWWWVVTPIILVPVFWVLFLIGWLIIAALFFALMALLN